MARSLIFIRLTLAWEDIGAVRGYVEDMRNALRNVEGFGGIGGWKGVDDPYARLIMISYETPESAGRALAATEEVKTLAEAPARGDDAARREGRHGRPRGRPVRGIAADRDVRRGRAPDWRRRATVPR